MLRQFETGPRTPELALAEIAVYGLVTLLATWYFESDLLREIVAYVRGKRPAAQSEFPIGPSEALPADSP
jgi:hypothetical protein